MWLARPSLCDGSVDTKVALVGMMCGFRSSRVLGDLRGRPLAPGERFSSGLPGACLCRARSRADGNPPLLSLAEDYPNGTWLGDENNPEMRVRCAIIPSDMLHISTNCRTAEKMALTLLDYLFHREVQAVSNLSGQGKHGKKQLDPLTIYGIRCKCGVLVPTFGNLRSHPGVRGRGSYEGEFWASQDRALGPGRVLGLPLI